MRCLGSDNPSFGETQKTKLGCEGSTDFSYFGEYDKLQSLLYLLTLFWLCMLQNSFIRLKKYALLRATLFCGIARLRVELFVENALLEMKEEFDELQNLNHPLILLPPRMLQKALIRWLRHNFLWATSFLGSALLYFVLITGGILWQTDAAVCCRILACSLGQEIKKELKVLFKCLPGYPCAYKFKYLIEYDATMGFPGEGWRWQRKKTQRQKKRSRRIWSKRHPGVKIATWNCRTLTNK